MQTEDGTTSTFDRDEWLRAIRSDDSLGEDIRSLLDHCFSLAPRGDDLVMDASELASLAGVTTDALVEAIDAADERGYFIGGQVTFPVGWRWLQRVKADEALSEIAHRSAECLRCHIDPTNGGLLAELVVWSDASPEGVAALEEAQHLLRIGQELVVDVGLFPISSASAQVRRRVVAAMTPRERWWFRLHMEHADLNLETVKQTFSLMERVVSSAEVDTPPDLAAAAEEIAGAFTARSDEICERLETLNDELVNGVGVN